MAKSLENYIADDEYLSKKQSELDKSRKDATSSLDEQRRRAAENAKITNIKLQKYIPQVLKNQGLGGNVGLTESSLIEANNNYSTRIADINASYNSAKNEIDAQHTQRKLALYDEAQNRLSSEQLEKYNMMLSDMENWQGTSAELKEYIDNAQENLNEEQYENLIRQYQNNAGTIDEAYETNKKYIGESRQVSGLSEVRDGNNFKVSLGNNTYKVEMGSEAAPNEDMLAKLEKSNVSDGEVFYYGGSVYVKHDGKIYTVRSRKHSDTTDLDALTNYLKIDAYEK